MLDIIFATLAFFCAAAFLGYIAGRRLGYIEIIAREQAMARRYQRLRPEITGTADESETLTCDNR